MSVVVPKGPDCGIELVSSSETRRRKRDHKASADLTEAQLADVERRVALGYNPPKGYLLSLIAEVKRERAAKTPAPEPTCSPSSLYCPKHGGHEVCP